jgi:sugar lactone lactonase YvrE
VTEATPVTDPVVHHGEGPFRDDRAGRLLWVDMLAGAVMSLDGGEVRHDDRDGMLRDTVRVAAARVTACAFGGPDRRTLYITTSRLDIPEGREPLAGSVFAWEAPVRGAAPHAWAG